jgi:NADPH:quinone reductase-like Zn-dependent oxidoreductase
MADQDLAREQWDATNYAAKDNLLRVVREEAESFFALAEVPEAVRYLQSGQARGKIIITP